MAELSARTGLSRQILTKWARRSACPKKVVPKTERGYLYAWPRWNDWYVDERIKVAVEKAHGTGALNDLEHRKLETDIALKEHELAERQGKFITVEYYQEHFESVIGQFAAVAAGQLHRYERQIVQAKTPADARRITGEMHRALMVGANELADRWEAEADAERAGEGKKG